MVGWRIALWAVIVMAALWFLYLVRSVLPPFVLAMLISAFLDPLIKKLRLRGFSRGWAIGLVFVGFFVVLVAGTILLTPTVSNQVVTLRNKVEDLTARLSQDNPNENYFTSWNPAVDERQATANQIDDYITRFSPTLKRLGLPSTRRAIVDQYLEPRRQELASSVQKFFTGFLGFVSGFASQLLLLLFTPLFVLLMLSNMDTFKRRTASWIPPTIRKQTLDLFEDVGQVFVNYLRGITIVVIYYIVIASVILTVLGAPYSVLLAVLFSLIYLVPIVGQFANAIILFATLMVSGKTGCYIFTVDSVFTYALIVTVSYAIIMVIFDQIFYARLVGNAVGLPPLVSFFVVFAGGALFGPQGMLFAFPLAGSVKVILDRLIKFTSRSHDALNLPVVPLRHRNAATG